MSKTSRRPPKPPTRSEDDRKARPDASSDPSFLTRRSVLSRIGILAAGLLPGSALAKILSSRPAYAADADAYDRIIADNDPYDPAGSSGGSRSDSDPYDPAGSSGGSRSDSDPYDPAGSGGGSRSDSDPYDPAGGSGSRSDSDPFDPIR